MCQSSSAGRLGRGARARSDGLSSAMLKALCGGINSGQNTQVEDSFTIGIGMPVVFIIDCAEDRQSTLTGDAHCDKCGAIVLTNQSDHKLFIIPFNGELMSTTIVSTEAGAASRAGISSMLRGKPLVVWPRIATVLRGKHKVDFTSHVDCGDYVIVTNVEKINMTGNKGDKSITIAIQVTGGLKSRIRTTAILSECFTAQSKACFKEPSFVRSSET